MNTKTKFVSSSYGKLMYRFDKLQAEKIGKNPSGNKKQQTTEVTIKKTEKISIQQQNHTTTIEKSGTLRSSSSSGALKERERSPYKTYDSVSIQRNATRMENAGSSHSYLYEAIKEKERSPYKTYDSVPVHQSTPRIDNAGSSHNFSYEAAEEKDDLYNLNYNTEPIYEETNDTDIDLEDEPDISKLDYYCRICDSHMNSLNMWDAHIAGKRHIKNKKNSPVQGRRKAVKGEMSNCAIHDTLREIGTEPVVGLNFITELQRSGAPPAYMCYLCKVTVTPASILEHILSSKHQGFYVKHVDPEKYALIESFELSKNAKDNLILENAKLLEEANGRGRIEVRVELPKQPLPKKKKQSEERSDSQVRSKEDEPIWKNHHFSYRKHKPDEEDHHASKKQKIVSNSDATEKDRFRSPTSSAISSKPWTSSAVVQKKMYQRKAPPAVPSKSTQPLVLSLDSSDNSSGPNSPEKPVSAAVTSTPLQAPAVAYGPQPPPSNLASGTWNNILDETNGCSREVKLQIMKKVCDFSIESDAEEKEIKDAVKALNNSLLQYKVRKIKELPRDMQRKIAAQLLADDDTSTSDISEYESGRSSRAGHPIAPGMVAFPNLPNAVPMFLPMPGFYQDPNMPPMQGLPLAPMHYPALPFSYDGPTPAEK